MLDSRPVGIPFSPGGPATGRRRTSPEAARMTRPARRPRPRPTALAAGRHRDRTPPRRPTRRRRRRAADVPAAPGRGRPPRGGRSPRRHGRPEIRPLRRQRRPACGGTDGRTPSPPSPTERPRRAPPTGWAEHPPPVGRAAPLSSVGPAHGLRAHRERRPRPGRESRVPRRAEAATGAVSPTSRTVERGAPIPTLTAHPPLRHNARVRVSTVARTPAIGGCDRSSSVRSRDTALASTRCASSRAAAWSAVAIGCERRLRRSPSQLANESTGPVSPNSSMVGERITASEDSGHQQRNSQRHQRKAGARDRRGSLREPDLLRLVARGRPGAGRRGVLRRPAEPARRREACDGAGGGCVRRRRRRRPRERAQSGRAERRIPAFRSSPGGPSRSVPTTVSRRSVRGSGRHRGRSTGPARRRTRPTIERPDRQRDAKPDVWSGQRPRAPTARSPCAGRPRRRPGPRHRRAAAATPRSSCPERGGRPRTGSSRPARAAARRTRVRGGQSTTTSRSGAVGRVPDRQLDAHEVLPGPITALHADTGRGLSTDDENPRLAWP